jgi:hypothetical protein
MKPCLDKYRQWEETSERHFAMLNNAINPPLVLAQIGKKANPEQDLRPAASPKSPRLPSRKSPLPSLTGDHFVTYCRRRDGR